ncbi:hypothetical protein BJ875DRAFT_371915 [Amylocarpus encephaloides]|uniref:UBA domain-containing protein n=1 Tax=Amylocarpus encephaloides TaxID=45428 RepID=A0A9P8C7A7_9HELO|nr:hypothetical protein BJ875DRAFT_371915 [Amylocarpus encephaloides]
MDDLNGLDWSAASSSTSTSNAPRGTGNYYPTLRPTPPPQFSGRSSPLSNQALSLAKSSASAASAPMSSGPDVFSNLVSFGSSKSGTLTLQQQHDKLQAEKRKREEDKRQQYEKQYGGGQDWESLGNRTQSPAPIPTIASRGATPIAMPLSSGFAGAPSSAISSGNVVNGGEDDLFAAFNKDTKVDNSSFYPPPSITSSRSNTPGFSTGKSADLSKPQAWEQPAGATGVGADFGDDDDPFGLGTTKQTNSTPAPTTSADDDDFLGDLGKPVEEVRRRQSPAVVKPPTPEPQTESNDPWDKAVAELVDMGFSAEQSRRALTESGSGLDVPAAVGWILNDAHCQAKSKQQNLGPSRSNGPSNGSTRDASLNASRKGQVASWMREEGRDRSQLRREDRSPNGEGDLSTQAAAMGNNLFKTANSLWKTSQKKIQKTVADFQQESDPSQPKWMREAAEREHAEREGAAARGRKLKAAAPGVTDEALMLEADSRPPPRKGKAPEQPRYPESNPSRDQSPAFPPRPVQKGPAVPRWQQQAPSDPRSRISKHAIKEQSEQAYVSPARRKKATPQPVHRQNPEPDLLFNSNAPSQPKTYSSRPTPPRATPVPSKPSTPIPVRPKAPPRNIPHLSSQALSTSTEHRVAGTTHFKRGDYASAHQSYSASLMSLPSAHPITIILFCNRALTSLKTGIPKSAVSDADTALELIGPSRGDGEHIDLGTENKEMREFWGKALMRKAEALEQMEKWREALDVWKQCVENNVGGTTAVQGRSRCEKALTPKPALTMTPTPKPRPVVKSALSDLAPARDSAAVSRLRAANREAERADDEKFALVDQVDTKISLWRDGKRDNLRALLGSLQDVMWESSNWKKLGMHELVQNNKVKIHYMKAIGRCHPDKLPQDASTEIRMIAGLVFATLNESWDKFKTQNGM